MSKYWTHQINYPGCEKISEACQNCYACEAHTMHYADGKGKGFFSQPFNVIRPEWGFIEAAFKRLDRMESGQVVFVGNMCDMFNHAMPDKLLYQLFSMVRGRPEHTFLFLTKRAQRMNLFINDLDNALDEDATTFEKAYQNVWLGVTAENQARADERIPILLDTPAAHRWVSVEPMLGPMEDLCLNCEGICYHTGCEHPFGNVKIDLVIAGGESGRKARPSSWTWFEDLYHQCKMAGTRFYLKQLGDNYDGHRVEIGDDAHEQPFIGKVS
jgi:protein gp37